MSDQTISREATYDRVYRAALRIAPNGRYVVLDRGKVAIYPSRDGWQESKLTLDEAMAAWRAYNAVSDVDLVLGIALIADKGFVVFDLDAMDAAFRASLNGTQEWADNVRSRILSNATGSNGTYVERSASGEGHHV